jgi:hypothetical protein
MTETITYTMGEILGKVSSCYLQAIIISFFVAGLIWALNKILTSDKVSNK